MRVSKIFALLIVVCLAILSKPIDAKKQEPLNLSYYNGGYNSGYNNYGYNNYGTNYNYGSNYNYGTNYNYNSYGGGGYYGGSNYNNRNGYYTGLVVIANADGTYYQGMPSECPYGCAINGVCGTETECATASVIMIVFLSIFGVVFCGCFCCFAFAFCSAAAN